MHENVSSLALLLADTSTQEQTTKSTTATVNFIFPFILLKAKRQAARISLSS